MLYRFNKSSLRGIVGLTICGALLIFQTTIVGTNFAFSLKEPSLFLLTQLKETSSIMRELSLWISSREVLAKRVLSYELRIRELESVQSLYEAARRENEDLKNSLDKQTNSIGATLLRGGSKFFVDRGEADGVRTGSLVTFRGAFVGVISDVYPNISGLDSIYDNEFRVGVRIERRDGVLGVMIVKRGQLLITTISRNEEVQLGDSVVTLGDNKVKQSGIIIGKIEKDLTRSADPVSTFMVSPLFKSQEIRALSISP